MDVDQNSRTASAEDRHLVDLVSAALVDPNIHTDTRIRLCDQISAILHTARADLQAGSGHQPQDRISRPREVPKVQESVLADPTVHTDTRTR